MSGVENLRLGQVELNPSQHARVEMTVGETGIAAALPPHRPLDDPEYVVGIEETIDEMGDRTRQYLKIQTKIRGASHAVVEYYDSHENLQKGVKAVSVVTGAVAVGSLVVWRYKKRRN